MAIAAVAVACGSFGDAGTATPEPAGSDAAVDALGAVDAAEASSASDARVDASRYRAAVMADSPVAYWRLGEAASAVLAKDEIGHHAGTYSTNGAIAFAAAGALLGDPDTAVKFDGNGRIAVGDAFDFANSTPFSIELWVKPAVIVGTNYRWLVSKQSASGGYFLQIAPDGAIGFGVSAGADSGATASIFAPLVADVFTHVVASYNTTTSRLYLNGALARQIDAIVAMPVRPAASLTIGGASFASPASDARGVLDEVALYDKALSLPQIQAHFAAGR